MVDSKISLKMFTRKSIWKFSRIKDFGMSIDSLMIWLLTVSKVREVSYGLVRTMMVMFSLILSPKVLDPSVS